MEIQRAKRRHLCCECGVTINVGDERVNHVYNYCIFCGRNVVIKNLNDAEEIKRYLDNKYGKLIMIRKLKQ